MICICKYSLRSKWGFLSSLSEFRPFSTGSSDRGEQARGAMREYLNSVSKMGNSQTDGIWARLRKGISENVKVPQKKQEIEPAKVSTKPLSPDVTKDNQNWQKRTTNQRIVSPKRPKSPQESEKQVVTARDKQTKNTNKRTSQSKQKPTKIRNPAIHAVLHDHEYFATKARAGDCAIDENGMDPLDKLMARSFLNSFKSSSNSYQIYLENPSMKKVQLPFSRSIRHLQYAIQPRIGAEIPSASYGTVTDACGVLQKNIYYNDRQKRELCESIAQGMLQVDSFLRSKGENSDDIFEVNFRRGLEGMEEEYKDRLLEETDTEFDDESNKAETNWDLEAVEDEDQL